MPRPLLHRPLLNRLGWIVSIPITLLVVLIAVMNRQPVRLSLWPLPWDIEAPLFLLVLGAILVGFFFGALAMWISAGATRRRLREARRALDIAQIEAGRPRRQTDGSTPMGAVDSRRLSA